MKHLFILFVLTGVLLQNFTKSIILIHYQINKEYITNNFCENKNKPEAKCCGHCHLKKQLDKQDKNEQAPNQNSKDKNEIQFFSKMYTINYSSFEKNIALNANYLFAISDHQKISVFQPPKC